VGSSVKESCVIGAGVLFNKEGFIIA